MTTTTTNTTRTAYTLLATGPRRVVVDYIASGRVRLAIAGSLPAANTAAWMSAAPDAGGRIVTVSAGLNLYGMTDPAATADVTVAISSHEEMVASSVEIANDVGNPVPVTGALTDTQLRATPLPVSATDLTALNTKTGAIGDTAWPGTGDATVIAALKAIVLAAAVATPAGGNLIGKVGRHIATAEATFNRPANTTAYASGQLIANSTTAGSVVPLNLTAARIATGSFTIARLRLRKTGSSIAGASFRVHLFSVAPTVANGDGGILSASGSASYLGRYDVVMDQAFTDGAIGIGNPITGLLTEGGVAQVPVKLASGQSIFALIEARGAYTPVSGETFTLALDVLQD